MDTTGFVRTPLANKKSDPFGSFFFGGEGGIRTRDTAFDRILAFQASTFNHSVTSPNS